MKKIIVFVTVFLLMFNFTYLKGQGKPDRLLKILNTTKVDSIKIKTLIKIGKVYIATEPDTTILYYQKALELSKKNNTQKYIAKTYKNIGNYHYYKSDYNEAIEYYLKALNINKKINNKEGIAINLGNIGLVSWRHSDYSTALEYYFKALKINEEIGNIKGIARIFGYIGIIYFEQSKYDKALEYHSKALKINKEIGYKTGIAINLGNIGGVYLFQNDYNKTSEYYFKSLKIKKEIGNKNSIAVNLINIGIIYSEQSNYDKAMEYFSESLEIYKKNGNKNGIATSLGYIGTVNFEQKNFEKALEYYLQALKIKKEIGNKLGIALNLRHLGFFYSRQNNYKKALSYYLESLKIYEKIDNKIGILKDLLKIGKLYNELKQYTKALSYLNRALKINKEIGVIVLQKRNYNIIEETFIGLRNYKKALEYKDKLVELNDSISKIENSKEILKVRYRLNYEKEIAIDSIATSKQIEIKDIEISRIKIKHESQTKQHNFLIGILFLAILFAGFVIRSNLQKKKANILLAIQKKEIEKIHHEISSSINYATRLQEAIMPEKTILDKYLSDYFILFKPKDKVSGDFYWWSHIGNHTVITAVDCTGHGVPGAFMSMLGTSLLREIVEKERIINTDVILERLRIEIVKALKQKGEIGEQQDGMEMAIISINHETNVVQFSGARNPLYILPNKELSNIEPYKDIDKFYEIKPDKMPISIYNRMDSFTAHKIQLNKGDIMYIFSDGFVDQFGGLNGKRIKISLFKQLLSKNRHKPMKEQKEILNNAFASWKGNFNQVDDVLIIGIKI